MLPVGREHALDFGFGSTRLADVAEHPLQIMMQRLDPDGERKLCPDCQCCELVYELCDECGGDGIVESPDDDDWAYTHPRDERCGVCWGSGGWDTCLGRCDENGEHPKLCPACQDKHAGACPELTLTGAA